MKTTKRIFYIICLVALASCGTLKKTIIHEVYKDSVVYRTDTVFKAKEVIISILGDTAWELYPVYLTDTIIKESGKIIGKVSSDTSHLVTDFAWSDAAIIRGELYHILVQKDTSWKRRYDSLQVVITSERSSFQKQIIQSSIKKRTEILTRIVLFLVGFVVIYLIMGFLKKAKRTIID